MPMISVFALINSPFSIYMRSVCIYIFYIMCVCVCCMSRSASLICYYFAPAWLCFQASSSKIIEKEGKQTYSGSLWLNYLLQNQSVLPKKRRFSPAWRMRPTERKENSWRVVAPSAWPMIYLLKNRQPSTQVLLLFAVSSELRPNIPLIFAYVC